MKRSRAIRYAWWCGFSLSAFGCAQIAGIGGDYQLAPEGDAGTPNDTGGATSNGGKAGNATHPDAGAPDTGGVTSKAGSSNGGTGGRGGTANGGGAGSGGSVDPGMAGAGGESDVGPVRIGSSEFHDSGSGSDNASSHLASATFAKPAGTAEGDFLLVFFGADHSLQNLSGQSLSDRGWTLHDQHQDYGTDGQATYLIYKFAGPNEPASIVFSDINGTPSGNGVQGLLSVYRGVNPNLPIDAYEVAVVTTGETDVSQVVTATPAITTTTPNCLLIAGLSPDTAVDTPKIKSWPQGFTEHQVSVINPPNPYPYGWADIYSAERHVATPSTIAASAFTWTFANATQYYGSLSFVLALAP